MAGQAVDDHVAKGSALLGRTSHARFASPAADFLPGRAPAVAPLTRDRYYGPAQSQRLEAIARRPLPTASRG
jgi:hypothetical protein